MSLIFLLFVCIFIQRGDFWRFVLFEGGMYANLSKTSMKKTDKESVTDKESEENSDNFNKQGRLYTLFIRE